MEVAGFVFPDELSSLPEEDIHFHTNHTVVASINR